MTAKKLPPDDHVAEEKLAADSSTDNPKKRAGLLKFRSKKSSEAKPSKKKKIIKWVLFTLLYLAFIAGGAYGVFRYNVYQASVQAKKVSDQIIIDVVHNSPKDLYRLSSNTFKKNTSLAVIEANVPRVVNQVTTSNWTVVEQSYKKTHGKEYDQVVYKFKSSKNSKNPYYIQIILGKDDGHWLMYHFNGSSKPFSNVIPYN